MVTKAEICEAYSLQQWGMTNEQWILELHPAFKDHPCELRELVQHNSFKTTVDNTKLTEMRMFNWQCAAITRVAIVQTQTLQPLASDEDIGYVW